MKGLLLGTVTSLTTANHLFLQPEGTKKHLQFALYTFEGMESNQPRSFSEDAGSIPLVQEALGFIQNAIRLADDHKGIFCPQVLTVPC